MKSLQQAVRAYKEAVNAKKVKDRLKHSEKALKLFQKGIFELEPSPKAAKLKQAALEYVALLYVMRGETFYKGNEWEAALDQFTRAWEVNKHAQDSHDSRVRELHCLQRRAQILSKRGDHDAATREVERLLSTAKATGDERELFDCLEVAAEVYAEAKKREKALQVYSRLVNLSKKLKLKEERADVFFRFAKFLASEFPNDGDRIFGTLHKAATLFRVQRRQDAFEEVLSFAREISLPPRVLVDYKDFLESVERSLRRH
ncbi:MAG: hypothetical protein Kow0069_21180 [Promethearchaeota archaeon]